MAYNQSENYCSLSPDRILGCTFNFGCYLHDRQYRNEVKIRKTRKEADIQLQQVIYKTLKESNSPFEISLKIKKTKIDIIFFESSKPFFINLRKKIALPWSMVYYYAVRIFAFPFWVK